MDTHAGHVRKSDDVEDNVHGAHLEAHPRKLLAALADHAKEEVDEGGENGGHAQERGSEGHLSDVRVRVLLANERPGEGVGDL